MLPAKGTDFVGIDAAVRIVADDSRLFGYRKVHFRSDGEPSLLAFLWLVQRKWEVEVISEHSVPGDTASHCAVKNAVKML